MYFVGIDAGGTKTDFLLCDENEKELKRVILGTGNPNDIGIEACLALLSQGLDELCEGITPNSVFAGVSGGGYGENAAKIHKLLQEKFPNSIVDNGTDAINLINYSRSDGNVAALICGTGNAIFVRKNGEILRFGGWGYHFENGGSAYEIGRAAIRHLLFCEEFDSEKLKSPLCKLLQDKLGGSAHNALSDIYARGKSYIASFAPIVFDAELAGDEAAFKIIDANVDFVVEQLSTVFSLIGDVDEIICAGGLFKSPRFCSLISQRVNKCLTIPAQPPVYGACRKAMRLMLEVDD